MKLKCNFVQLVSGTRSPVTSQNALSLSLDKGEKEGRFIDVGKSISCTTTVVLCTSFIADVLFLVPRFLLKDLFCIIATKLQYFLSCRRAILCLYYKYIRYIFHLNRQRKLLKLISRNVYKAIEATRTVWLLKYQTLNQWNINIGTRNS